MTTTERLVTTLPQQRRLTRVIRNVADATKDYYIPELRAEVLFARGELTLRETRNGSFEFASPTGREVR